MHEISTSEIRETNSENQPLPEKTKAFENAGKVYETAVHIPTINEKLADTTYPNTDVQYRKHEFIFNGEKAEGVFPEFKSKFDIALPKELYKESDTVQFKYCTNKLKEEILKNPDMEKQFTPRQIDQIQNCAPRIAGLTWHHNELPGKMQLVEQNTHALCHHTGGRSIWGGGQECRKDQ